MAVYQNEDDASSLAAAEDYATERSSVPIVYKNYKSFRHSDDSDIFRNLDGEVYDPLATQNSHAIFTFNCVCLIIGLVASSRVIYKTVATCNEGGWRPRHVLLIGAIVSCILTLLVHCFIPIIYSLWPNDDLCRFFVAVHRLPYVAFIFHIFLLLVDRYVAVTRSTWHRSKLSKMHCVIWLSLLNLLLAMAIKWSFIAQVESLECAFNFLHSMTILVAIIVLILLCTGLLITVFIITWRQLPQAARAIPVPHPSAPRLQLPSIDKQPQPPPMNLADIEYVSLKDLLPPEEIPPPTVADKIERSCSPSKTVDPSSTTLRRMELEVTKHFLFNLIPLFVVLIPLISLGFSIIGFLFFYPDEESYVATLISYIVYFAVLPTLHVVMYPLANLFLNKEISFSNNCPFCCCHEIPSPTISE